MVVGGIGAKMLTKMGWSAGTGLGAKRDGMLAPISVKKRPENLGVGAERRPYQDTWWEKMMDDAYGKTNNASDPDALFEACEGRRCRPHGSAKLARLEAQENSGLEGLKVAEEEQGLQILKKREKNTRKKSSKKKVKKGSVSDGEQSGRIRKKRRKSRKSQDEKSLH